MDINAYLRKLIKRDHNVSRNLKISTKTGKNEYSMDLKLINRMIYDSIYFSEYGMFEILGIIKECSDKLPKLYNYCDETIKLFYEYKKLLDNYEGGRRVDEAIRLGPSFECDDGLCNLGDFNTMNISNYVFYFEKDEIYDFKIFKSLFRHIIDTGFTCSFKKLKKDNQIMMKVSSYFDFLEMKGVVLKYEFRESKYDSLYVAKGEDDGYIFLPDMFEGKCKKDAIKLVKTNFERLLKDVSGVPDKSKVATHGVLVNYKSSEYTITDCLEKIIQYFEVMKTNSYLSSHSSYIISHLNKFIKYINKYL